MNEYKVGDRVKHSNGSGKLGTVMRVEGGILTIKWDNGFGGGYEPREVTKLSSRQDRIALAAVNRELAENKLTPPMRKFIKDNYAKGDDKDDFINLFWGVFSYTINQRGITASDIWEAVK